jgi:hypothetical protein
MGNDRAAVTTLVSHARKCWSRFRRSRYLAEVKDRETLINSSARGTAAMQEANFVADSLLQGSGFEPSVPLPRLSSIRAVRAEIIGLSARPRVRCLCSPEKTQHLLPKSVFDRPGSDRRWNLASTTFPDSAAGWTVLLSVRRPLVRRVQGRHGRGRVQNSGRRAGAAHRSNAAPDTLNASYIT